MLAPPNRPRCAWLPSYLCETIVHGFQAADTPIKFFPVDSCLRVVDDTWLSQVADGDLVLRINYFGFINHDPIFSAARARGACLVDDAAQALLTAGVGRDAEFTIFSPRKFLGVPDGGCLVPKSAAALREAQLAVAPSSWWNHASEYAQGSRTFKQTGVETDWFAEFQAAERSAPIGPYAMSEVSRELLDNAFDYDAIAQTRRENFLELARHLAEFALFSDLPAGVVPLGFPVVVAERDRVRQALFAEKIYPPVHWAIEGTIPASFAASHQLARSVMTLPCDQRYHLGDMRRMAQAFLKTRPVRPPTLTANANSA